LGNIIAFVRYLLGIWVSTQGKVNNRLLVGEFITLRELNHTIQSQNGAISFGFEYKHILGGIRPGNKFLPRYLELRASLEKNLLDLQAHALA